MTIAIFGDIHGESKKLRSLLADIINLHGPTDFYSVGDFIDRGPDSKGVIQTCIDEGIQGILGNHELWFAKLLKHSQFDKGVLHPIMGARATLSSYQLNPHNPVKALDTVPSDHKEYILNLPLTRRIEFADTVFWLIHAGVQSSLGGPLTDGILPHLEEKGVELTDELLVAFLEEVASQALLWNHLALGEETEMHRFPDGGVQVFGHTPMSNALDGGHYIALDTGCGRRRRKPNYLTAVVVRDDGSRSFMHST